MKWNRGTKLLGCLICCGCGILLDPPVIAKAPGEDPQAKRARYTQYAMRNEGDARAGEKLFNDASKTACINCHALHGIEKSGPNLDGIADKYPRIELIRHIIDPNAFIQPGYETASVLTDAGEVITGRLRLSTRLEVRLLLASGKLRSIKRESIDQFKSANVSMMPDDLINALTPEEFTDLIAYLDSLHAAELNAWKGPSEELVFEKADAPIQLSALHPAALRFDNPVWVCEIPGHAGHLIVLEHQEGIAQHLDLTTQPPAKRAFLDLSEEITFSPNQGLMCVAFHPNYTENGKYYLKYEIQQHDGTVVTTINERLASPNRLEDSGMPSRRLLEQEQPAFNHNGGCLAFGPDGMLYIAFGDGGPQKDPPGYSQNPRVYHGSMLRIDVDRRDPGRPYAVPPDNPFGDRHQRDPHFHPETWAYGFREPWRFSFDAKTGELWLGDVGQVKYEEVCLVRAGENHGWNVYEGFVEFSDEYRRSGEVYTRPVLAYPRSLGVSVTGGYVYRGNPDSPWYGHYIFGDYESRKIWALKLTDGRLQSVQEIGESSEHIASFGTNSAGDIFLVGYEGTIFRLEL